MNRISHENVIQVLVCWQERQKEGNTCFYTPYNCTARWTSSGGSPDGVLTTPKLNVYRLLTNLGVARYSDEKRKGDTDNARDTSPSSAARMKVRGRKHDEKHFTYYIRPCRPADAPQRPGILHAAAQLPRYLYSLGQPAGLSLTVKAHRCHTLQQSDLQASCLNPLTGSCPSMT
jgi:hypothetical protein